MTTSRLCRPRFMRWVQEAIQKILGHCHPGFPMLEQTLCRNSTSSDLPPCGCGVHCQQVVAQSPYSMSPADPSRVPGLNEHRRVDLARAAVGTQKAFHPNWHGWLLHWVVGRYCGLMFLVESGRQEKMFHSVAKMMQMMVELAELA